MPPGAFAGSGSAVAFGSVTTKDRVVKVRHKKQPIRFGDWIARVYDVCGERKAPMIVQLAVNGRVVKFRERQRS